MQATRSEFDSHHLHQDFLLLRQGKLNPPQRLYVLLLCQKTRGYGLMGCRDLGKVEVGVRFPLAPPMSRSSNKTGIPEDTALSGGDEGENPSLLSMTECRWEYSLQS